MLPVTKAQKLLEPQETFQLLPVKFLSQNSKGMATEALEQEL